MQVVAWLVLLIALVVVAAIMQKRHRRVMRRLDRLEHAESELLRFRRRVYSTWAGARPGEVWFRGQFGEDLFLWDLFEGKHDGRFFECGAYDGETFSVSLGFERAGWDGLLVEAIPERAEACERARRARVVNTALSAPGCPETIRFRVQQGGVEQEIMSRVAGAKDAGPGRSDTNVREVEVPCATLDKVLERVGMDGGFDFMVLDVEGHECELLRGFALAQQRPRVLMIEDFGPTRAELDGILSGAGYVTAAWLGYNRVSILREETGLIARAKGLVERVPFPSRVAPD